MPRIPQLATTVLVVLSASIPIAACGGSGASHAGGGAAGSGPGVRYAACVRAHGVPNYPDSGNGIELSGNTTAGTATVSGQAVPERVLEAAEDKCLSDDAAITHQPKYSPAQLARFQAMELTFSECMRAHGVTNYPDFRILPGPEGRGTRYVVIGPAPGPYAEPAFRTATGHCDNLLSSQR